MKILEKVWSIVLLVLLAAWAGGMFYWFMKDVLAPIGPFMTAICVAVGTVVTLRRLVTAALALAGIALYALSWWIHLAGLNSQLYVSWVCAAGIMAWFVALYIAAEIPKPWRWAVTTVKT